VGMRKVVVNGGVEESISDALARLRHDLIRERYIWERLKGRGEFGPRRGTRPCHLPNASVNHLRRIVFNASQLCTREEDLFTSLKKDIFFMIIGVLQKIIKVCK